MNRRLVLESVLSKRACTRPELSSSLNLSKTTIKQICDDLIGEGILREGEEIPSQRQGRPAAAILPDTDYASLLAIDIGADKLIVRLADFSGATLHEIQKKISAPSSNRPTRELVLRTLNGALDELLAQSDPLPAPIRTVVAGAPGIVNSRTNTIDFAPQIANWEGIDLKREIAGMLPVHESNIDVERQADLFAIAESRGGVAANAASALCIELGIGIGGSIIIDNKIYHGANAAAGEIGYLPISFGEVIPRSSGIGMWEWACGGGAFARHGRDIAATNAGNAILQAAGGDIMNVDAKAVFLAAAEHDTTALNLIDELGQRISTGIAAAICILNPEIVVIGGGISRAGDLLLDTLNRHIADMVPYPPLIRLSQYGEKASLEGAVFKAQENIIQSI